MPKFYTLGPTFRCLHHFDIQPLEFPYRLILQSFMNFQMEVSVFCTADSLGIQFELVQIHYIQPEIFWKFLNLSTNYSSWCPRHRFYWESTDWVVDTGLSLQEICIDRLTQQIQDIKTNLSSIEAQILVQRSETNTAQDALLQSYLEMEKIDFERNQLMKEWKSSLIEIEVHTKVLNSLEAD